MGQSMRWAEGFIAVDWGTTNRRAYLMDRDSRCVEEFEDGQGILSVPSGGFHNAVGEILEPRRHLRLRVAHVDGVEGVTDREVDKQAGEDPEQDATL